MGTAACVCTCPSSSTPPEKSAAVSCSGPLLKNAAPPPARCSLPAFSSTSIATASASVIWSGKPTTAANSKVLFPPLSATVSTSAFPPRPTPIRATSKPSIASKKTSSLISKTSPAAAISSPKSTLTSSTSISHDPTPTNKTSLHGKSSSASRRAPPSNSACFHPCSWTTTLTTQGDTMWVGFPILSLVPEINADAVSLIVNSQQA